MGPGIIERGSVSIFQPVFLVITVLSPFFSVSAQNGPNKLQIKPRLDLSGLFRADRGGEECCNLDSGYFLGYAGFQLEKGSESGKRIELTVTERNRTQQFNAARQKRVYESKSQIGEAFFRAETNGVSVRGGRWRETIADGLIFGGDATGGEIAARLHRNDQGGVLSFAAISVKPEEHRREEPEGRSDFVYGRIGYFRRTLSLEGVGGYYFVAGQPQIPDLPVPGFPSLYLPVGQPQIAETGVHYYSVSLRLLFGRFQFAATAIHDRGFRTYPTLFASDEELDRKRITGGVVYGELSWFFLRSTPAPHSLLRRGEEKVPFLQIGFLATSKDRSDTDDRLNGYDAIRPAIAGPGGEASQILCGGLGYRAPFRNLEPGHPMYEYESPDRNRGERTLPSYDASVEVASIGLVWPVSFFRFDLHASAARFKEVVGEEGVLTARFRREGAAMKWDFFLSGSLLSLRERNRSMDPVTGMFEIHKERRKRFLAGFRFSL